MILAADLSRAAPSVSPISPDEEVLPPSGIEQQTFVDQTRAEMNKINDLMKTISSLYNIEPIFIDLNKENAEKLKTAEELSQEAFDAFESKTKRKRSSFDFSRRLEQYKYSALETENTEEEVDEEEGEEEEEEEHDDDEGEEEEVDLFKRDRKKHLGDTSIYDPVALVEKNILQPGKPDFLAVYRGKTYRFANEDNRANFLQTPLKYLPIDRPPSVRRRRRRKKDFLRIDFVFSSIRLRRSE